MNLNSLSNITKYLSFLFLIFSTLPASAAPQVAVSASRTSCTAPCAVFFDATGTTSSTTGRPFHDVDYTWDFSDSGSGTWATTGRSKNSAKGGVAAHVFQTAGTYQVKLSAKDSSGTASGQATITVADPNTTFVGAKTRCVSTSGNFSGCPAGAQQVTSTDIGAQVTWLNGAGGQRLLLRGGDSWSTSKTLYLNAAGPGLFGAYGTGKPTISTSVNGDMDVIYAASSNWVIAGLKLLGPTETPSVTTRGFSVKGGLNNVLLLGNEITRFPNSAAGHSWSLSNDSLFVVDNYFHNNGMYQGYFGGNRIGIVGNRMEYTNQSHVLRTWYMNKSVIGENILRFPSYVNTAMGRHALKFHTDRVLTSLPSQYAVISGNTMQGSVYVVVIGPQDTLPGAEKIDNVVFERNKLLHSPPNGTTSLLRLSATNTTVRNNVFDSTDAKYSYGIEVFREGQEPAPNNTHILNNVFLRTDAGVSGSEYKPINISSVSTNTMLRNNIGYAPSYNQPQTWNESSTAASNNLVYTPNAGSLCKDGQGHTGSGYCVNPNFASTDPANAAYLKLNSGSPAIDKGVAMPMVPKDFWEGSRPQGSGPDLGIHEYGSTASTTPTPVTTAPTADFTPSKTSGTAPLGVTFTPAATGTFTGWSWDYNGDGTPDSSGTTTTNTVPTAVTTYNNAGTYTVSLTLTGPNGNVTKTKPGLITVTAPTTSSAPTANFTANATSGVAPLAVTFTNTSTGTIGGYSWSFGDGTSSTAQSPAHSYSAAGTYTVSLTVTGSAGSNTATKAGYITVTTASGGTGSGGSTSGTPAGLVAAYGFEESTGTLTADASGQKNHGTISGATRATGKFGKALSFNGLNNSVTIKDSASLDVSSGLTLEAWVYPKTTTGGGRTVILKEKTGGAVYNLYSSEDANLPLSSVFVGGYRVISSKTQLPLNQWSHLAATYDGQSQRLYINGLEVANRPQTGPIQTSGGALRIGGNSLWGEWFNGSIDEVRIYNRALAANEVQADMNKSVASATPPRSLLGTATVGTTVYPNPKGVATAFQATASATGLLTRLSVYPDASATSTTLAVGIYSDNLGHPGQRLGTASVTAIAPGKWNAIALPATSVTQGTKYWIALLSPNAILQVRAGNGGNGGVMETSAQTGLTALPWSWTTGATFSDGPVSAYGAGY
jgi:PKD repeat protein